MVPWRGKTKCRQTLKSLRIMCLISLRFLLKIEVHSITEKYGPAISRDKLKKAQSGSSIILNRPTPSEMKTSLTSRKNGWKIRLILFPMNSFKSTNLTSKIFSRKSLQAMWEPWRQLSLSTFCAVPTRESAFIFCSCLNKGSLRPPDSFSTADTQSKDIPGITEIRKLRKKPWKMICWPTTSWLVPSAVGGKSFSTLISYI